MSEEWNAPLPWRSGFAAIGAVAVAALTGLEVVSSASGDFAPSIPTFVFGIAFLLAGFHAMVVGAPLYAFARNRWRLGWLNAMIGGALTATIPTVVVFFMHLMSTLFEQAPLDLQFWISTLALFGVSGGVAGLTYRAMHGPDRRSIRA